MCCRAANKEMPVEPAATEEVRGVKMQTVCSGAAMSHSRVAGLRP